MLSKLKTNFRKVREELDHWKKIKQVHWNRVKKAKNWFRLKGEKDGKLHALKNVWTEFVKACPRTVAEAVMLVVILLVVAAFFVIPKVAADTSAVPLVYTYQPRDTTPIVGATVGGVPVKIDEGANWQWKMDAGRFYDQTESDIVLDDQQGNLKFLTACTTSPEICAGQSSTVSHDAKWIVYQKSLGRSTFAINAMYTSKPIKDRGFRAYMNELWAYNVETQKSVRLTTGHQDITPKFCGNRLLWASDRWGSFPPYTYDSGNPYPHRGTTIVSAPFINGKLGEISNLTPHEMLTMSPECLHTGDIIYSSYQGYSKKGMYKFTSTPQLLWWLNIIDGNGANALTIASLGAHNSPYIPTSDRIMDELSSVGGARVSTMLILRPARQVAIKNGKPYICVGNYYRTNHVGGGGEGLCYSQSEVEGVSKSANWLYGFDYQRSTVEGSGAFVPIDLESLTPWGNGFDNPPRFDKQGRIMGKSNYFSAYPGNKLMFTWFQGACYEPVLSFGPDWATRTKMGGGPTCQLSICLTDLAMTSNPHKQCEILAGNEKVNVWDAHPVVPYSDMFGMDMPEVPEPLPTGVSTELRVVDFTKMELNKGPNDPGQEYKYRVLEQGHATPDVANGRMDKFCVDVVEPWGALPTHRGYKSRTLFKCVEPKADGSISMKVPPDTLILMYGVDSKFQFPVGRQPTWQECIEVHHGMCVVAEDLMLHSLREGEKRTCHGCHDAHSEERFNEVGRKSAEERFKATDSFTPAGC